MHDEFNKDKVLHNTHWLLQQGVNNVKNYHNCVMLPGIKVLTFVI